MAERDGGRKIRQDEEISEESIAANFKAYRSYLEQHVHIFDLIGYYVPFTEEDKRKLYQESKPITQEAVRTAFSLIEQMTVADKYVQLLSALEKAERPKLVDLLKGMLVPGGNTRNRERINSATPHIYERLTPSNVVPHLVSYGVITRDECQYVINKETKESRLHAALELLYMLPNRRKDWYILFLKALVYGDEHTQLAELIDQRKTNEIKNWRDDRIETMSVDSGSSLQSPEKLDEYMPQNKTRTAEFVDGTIKHFTDQHIGQYCNPCLRDDSHIQAASYCQECGEFYCQVCLGYHRRFWMLAEHAILYGEDMPVRQADRPVRYRAKWQYEDGNLTAPMSSRTVKAAAPLPVKLIKKEKINLRLLDDDTKYCMIYGLDITVNDTMILANSSENKLHLLSPEGWLLSSLALPKEPSGVAVINKSEAAVCMHNKQIGIIYMSDTGRLYLNCVIKTELYNWRITTYNNSILTISSTSNMGCYSVQMIDKRGRVLWSTTTDSEGKKVFDCAFFLITCSGDDGDTVIVTDWKKQTITVHDAGTGKVVKVYDVKGKKPRGMTVDDNGNVYVCYKSGQISVWSKTMEVEKSLVSGSVDLKLPHAIAYNSRRRELLLSSRPDKIDYGNFIHRYSISMT